jgi:two-component system sensor histidine kinase KdpD
MTEDRNPDLFLNRWREAESKMVKGRLKIFFGAIAGVGKTYSMLEAAQKIKQAGTDVIVGYVETHGRQETAALLEGLEILPLKKSDYRGVELQEFDIDKALARKPELILVDELAHTNISGSRHSKRWQDVQELLEAGISVFTTLNVQHIESLQDIVSQITGITMHERVPDSLLETAFEIELVDLPPDELIQRLKEGKVYIPEQAKKAIDNFFKKGNLIALRELSLRYTAEHVDAQMQEYRQANQIKDVWPATEKILVCISPSPLSFRIVRAAKRMAWSLHAQWIAAYVETSETLRHPRADKDRVVQTLRLAEQLGAQTLELTGDDISEEIIKYAKQYNVSKIIVGKPTLPRWREIIFGSIVDDIIRKSGAIDVYVITGERSELGVLGSRRLRPTSKWDLYISATVLVIIATGIASLMHPYFELSNVVMIYILGIVIASTKYGRGPSILASILSVGAFDFFFVPPFYTFAVADTQYLITFAVMLTIALVISTLTVRTRQQAEAARLREARTATLYSMSRELATCLDMNDIVEIGIKHIGEIFNCQVSIMLPDENKKLKIARVSETKHAFTEPDQGVAIWVFHNGQLAGLGTNTLPGNNALYIPLVASNRAIGVLAVRPTKSDHFSSPEQLHLLETFANQIALAWERANLSKENESTRLEIYTEQLRNSLLSSVSHDLRTPLATISGAASSIIEGTEKLDIDSCKEMAKEIYSESARLNRLVSNLLDMTQVQSGNLTVNKDWHPIDEIIGVALNCIDEKLSNRKINTHIARELPLIAIDATLIQQVLVNLFENAIKYTPAESPIDISASILDHFLLIEVADRGPGIDPANQEKIFQKFFQADRTKSTGVGLGLAICNGVIEAHGGKIWVENRIDGGASFKFTLPLSDNPPKLMLESDK